MINFILKHPEVVQGTKDKETDDKGNKLIKANIRLWTKYFDSLSGIKDFEDADSFVLLMNLGTCLPNEHMQLFAQFIKQKLDKLPTPAEIITHKNEKTLEAELKTLVGKGTGKSFRADIASILCKRVVNFCLYNEDFFRDAKEGKDRVKRVGDVLFAWELFGKDLVQLAARKLVKMNHMKALMTNQKFLDHFR